ncbi:MAG: dual specificity protein phosphatase family protein [Cytophagales bacterium]|nr:dual specificity protein phosphatase family protein [Armatimonadota bacterium]
MNYTVSLSLLGAAQIGLGVSTGGLAGFLLGWSGVSFLTVGIAYAGVGPRVFGKRPDGRVHWANTLFLLPYLALTHFLGWARCRSSRDKKNEIIEGLFLGQRLTSTRDLPENTILVVDFTSEFQEPKEIRAGKRYLYVPTLDSDVPKDKLLREVIEAIMQERERKQGAVYVHCALGRGRSAMAVSGVLIASGLADSVAAAEAMVRERRGGIRLSRTQRAALERYRQTRIA